MKLRLLGSPRNFPDLPKSSDGTAITWEAWKELQKVSHVSTACEQCGSGTSMWMATGIWLEPGTRHVDNRYCNINRGRGKHRETIHFHAVRCGWCGHTSVYTMHDEKAWDLEASDYSAHGSYDIEEAELLF